MIMKLTLATTQEIAGEKWLKSIQFDINNNFCVFSHLFSCSIESSQVK